MATLTETSDYNNFDPYWYLEHYFGTEEASFNIQTDLDALHKIFSEYNIRGKRLLDVGTGPSIHSVITSSNHVDEIFLSDYAQPNLEYLEKWRRGEVSQPTKNVNYAIGLEGRQMTAEQRENEVREKVKGILPIDVTSEQPLGCDYNGGKFDVIISSGCIEAATKDVAGYTQCIKNIYSLLNKDGVFIVTGDLGGENYQVGDFNYTGLSITKQEVQTAIKQTGYDIKLYMEIAGSVEDSQFTDSNGYYYVVATK